MEKAEDRQQNEYKDGSETKDTYSEYKNSDPAPYTYSHKPHSNFLSFSSDGFASSTRTDESPRTYIARSEDGTIVKQMMDFNDDGISQHEQYADTTVAISLVESTIRRENNPPKEDTTCYVVDYGSDED